MRVAIDTGPLTSGHKVRGIGVHTRELLDALKRVKGKNTEIEEVDFAQKDLSKYDIAHYQNFHPFFVTLPVSKVAKKSVVTIHDTIPLIYPEQYAAGIKGRFRYFVQKQRLKNVDAVITISETSKKDICRFLGVKPTKVHVAHLAARSIFKKINSKTQLEEVRKKYKLPKKFVLYVGDINYNKNILTLIKACKKADVALVICGKQAMDIEDKGMGLDTLSGPQDWIRFLFNLPHPELAHYEKLVDHFRVNPKIMRLGFVPDEDLVAIYNLATLYCQPSYYEGFGLPVLEAMAVGTPVLASKIQAHVEIAEGVAVFANPKSVKSFTEKIKKLMKDKKFQGELSKNGLVHTKNLSWEKTAKKTLDVYKKLNE